VLLTPLYTYPGVVGVDGLATKEGVDPKTLSRGVGVAPDVQDGALLEAVHVPSLHFQGTLFTAPFLDVSNLTPPCICSRNQCFYNARSYIIIISISFYLSLISRGQIKKSG
jgi:hypothetical protein